LGTSQSVSSKLRRLRIFNVVVATLTYCVRNAGRLFVVAWFPCLLASASRLALEWLIFAWPPRMPGWLLFNQLDPPTWLTALLPTPWEAMAWGFVLSAMADKNSTRGLVTISGVRIHLLRFELSAAVFIAAAILSLTNLIEGAARYAQLQLVVAALRFFELSAGTELNLWAYAAAALRFTLIVMLVAWLYPIAGHVLRTGAFDVARVWQAMHGNRLRLIAVFMLLTMALTGLDRLVQPATTWLARSLANPLSWTLEAALIHSAIDFPLSMLWTVAWAVLVGIVLDALETPSTERERGGVSAA
jgi:hypothetical protein